ncbi:MAG: hypothetical protein COB20_13625 [SAR86 cluster bacterium]|uniref:Sulfatase-modifying factor enzyme-like domain-containing protein n=1 Tax=SAR86 cluster bacterium TaxID=2030880 RepID=A0A2A4WY28_9GAMM|nr:MAG: hypothetical protein COB20_13625 [SAR86 cluster bacterium]
MTNTKQLTGAVALLASIAVLDNFIFIELKPGFESMVLIEPYGTSSATEAAQASDSLSPQNGVQDFWIDQDKVSGTDFATFLASAGYEPFTVPPNIVQAHTSRNGDFTAILASDNWKPQAGNAHWNKPSNRSSLSMPHTLAGQDDLEVSFKDALAYCNWLGKDLPTAEQIEHIVMKDHDQNISDLIEFRCVKNI